MKFEIYCSLGYWFWRSRARNGRITADGAEAYASLSNARRAVHRHVNALGATDFEIIEI